MTHPHPFAIVAELRAGRFRRLVEFNQDILTGKQRAIALWDARHCGITIHSRRRIGAQVGVLKFQRALRLHREETQERAAKWRLRKTVRLTPPRSGDSLT